MTRLIELEEVGVEKGRLRKLLCFSSGMPLPGTSSLSAPERCQLAILKLLTLGKERTHQQHRHHQTPNLMPRVCASENRIKDYPTTLHTRKEKEGMLLKKRRDVGENYNFVAPCDVETGLGGFGRA